MRFNSAFVVCSLLFFIIAGVLSCGNKDVPVIVEPNKPVTVVSVSTPPNLQNIVNDPVWATIDSVSVVCGEKPAFSNAFGILCVNTKAITDGNNVYMRFTWIDYKKDVRPGYWVNERCEGCTVWSQDLDTAGILLLPQPIGLLRPYEQSKQRWENEDVLALFFDMGGNGGEGANCATTCHFPDTNSVGWSHWTTGGGTIDAWVWRAGRTNPVGLADDQVWGGFDATNRNDSYTVEIYQRNGRSSNDITDPKWMHKDGPRNDIDFLYANDISLDLDPIDYLGWNKLDGIPGYAIDSGWQRGAETSRYDVRAASQYDDASKKWTVVLWRRLGAPHTGEDVNFEAGKEISCTMAIMDHTNRRHSGSQVFKFKF